MFGSQPLFPTYKDFAKYLDDLEGATIILPWPRGYVVTINRNNRAEILSEDVSKLCEAYLCCEKDLSIIGVIHERESSDRIGPIVFQGTKGHIFAYNQYGENAMYYLAESFEDFFAKHGLRYFYPIYLTRKYLSSEDTTFALLRYSITMTDLLSFRDANVNVGIVLRSHPWLTYLTLIKKLLLCEDTLLWFNSLPLSFEPLFLAVYYYKRRWIRFNIVINETGQLYAIRKKKLILIADDMDTFLRLGCLRYEQNRRYYVNWVKDAQDSAQWYVLPKCVRTLCKRRITTSCCIF